MDEIKSMTSQCRECALAKPLFYQPPNVSLIKATQPFERISVDFKGPLPSNTRNKYMLTLVDEYSRFPFASNKEHQQQNSHRMSALALFYVWCSSLCA